MSNVVRNADTPPGETSSTLLIDLIDNPDVAAIARRVTISVEEAASLLGIGRSAAYDAARRGQLPTRRLGRRLFVPVPAFLAWLGFDSEANE